MISNIFRWQTLNRLGKESEVTGYLGTSLSGCFVRLWEGLLTWCCIIPLRWIQTASPFAESQAHPLESNDSQRDLETP